ncbi:sulfotransferase [Aequorivita todarodis]|uniref:sulfotransferase family protein n=1 Tax=Aequorivita todarodis TaxID=2036821 RepID=UPI00235035C4|nr:sulfotransferase [Aequorivita todarodis]MDC8000249.1 sulfotransferase [Aequorivita todarodis]
MMESKKANLFVVGAMKAGTTFFTEILSQHPQIYLSPIKEPHYFINSLPKNLYEPSRFFSLENYLANDFPAPLHIAKVEKLDQYQKLFSLASEAHLYRAEASTAYLHAPESAGLIHEYNPNAKIIILLREPLKRAFSHYNMDKGLGRVKMEFETLVKDEIVKYNNGALPWNSYLGMSFYNNAINRYQSFFEDVLVVNFEDLTKNKTGTLNVISKFLNINEFTAANVERTNETKQLRFQKVFYILKQLGLKDYFSKIFSQNFRQRLFRLVSSNTKSELNISEQTQNDLTTIFNNESRG